MEIAYNPAVPIEKFDFIVTDECHRSIYNLWRQVLECFDASLIGLAADAATVTFAYKDYAADSRPKTMTLPTAEFVRRFCLHVLPERFVKIRHYGLLGNRQKQTRLARARELLAVAPPAAPAPVPELLRAPLSTLTPLCCPFCQQPGLIKIREVPPRRARLDSS